MKIKFFDEPFYPWDIYLLKNAFLISESYLNTGVVISLLVVLLTVIYLSIKFRARLFKAFRPAVNLNVLPLALLLLIINVLLLNSTTLLSGLNISKSWYVGKEEIQANGFFVQNYFYLSDLKKYLFAQPQNYSYQKMQEISKSLSGDSNSKSKGQKKPNVIVVMSESFWNPTKLKNIAFSKDITQNLRKYQKGELVCPVVGGATANTEFEALTGLSMYFLGPGTIPYNVYLRRNTPSLATVFNDNGYNTIAIHPNTGDFYNRSKVYGYFGFDSFIDITEFNLELDMKGPHVSDDRLVDKILNVLNFGEEPKFIFAVTIQNHDPYYNIYSDLDVHAESDKLDNTEISIMSNYAQGIYDADRALGKLIDSLKDSDTPTLVYFFGDHLPRLGTIQNMYDIYYKLDYSSYDNILKDPNFYKTPLVVWSNYTEIKPFEAGISPAQIAYDVLSNSGISYPAYFNILSKLRREHPVLHLNFKENVDTSNQFVSDYNLIQYDILFGDQYMYNLK